MKIIYLYSVCIATLLIACEEGRNEVKERKLTVDNAVNTDAIQSPIAAKEHTLEEYPSEKKQPISEPKVEKKARLATKDSFSQTSTKSDVQPLALFPIIREVAHCDDDHESECSVATEPSPRVTAESFEKPNANTYSDACTQSSPLQSNVEAQTLTVKTVETSTHVAHPEHCDAAIQIDVIDFPKSLLTERVNNNQAIFSDALQHVQEKFQSTYAARESKSYNDFIAEVANYKAAHQNVNELLKEFALLGQITEKFNTQLTEFCSQYPESAFDQWQSNLDKSLSALYAKREVERYPFLEKIAQAFIENVQKLYEGEVFECASLSDVAHLIANDIVPIGETLGIKGRIKAGDLDGVVLQLSPLFVEKLNIVLIENPISQESGAYTLSQIKEVLAAPEGTQGGAQGVPGLANKSYPCFKEDAILWSQGKKITSTDLEKFRIDLLATSKTTIKKCLLEDSLTRVFFRNVQPLLQLNPNQLSDATPNDMHTSLYRSPRRSPAGSFDVVMVHRNLVDTSDIVLNQPLFVQLKSDISHHKTASATTGSIAYRLGNTVIGAIQAYASKGKGFDNDGYHLKSSLVMSQNIGACFMEGQVGFVTAHQIHNSEWNGYCSQITLGVDTAYITPFLQLTHRQLVRNNTYTLNEITEYVGLDIEIADVAFDAYSITAHMKASVGVCQKCWTDHSKNIGTTHKIKGSLEWDARLTLNDGLSFNTYVNINQQSDSAAGVALNLER